MFVSFLIPSGFEGRPARHLLVFYRQLQSMRPENVAFIGEPDYFQDPKHLQRHGRPEWEASWRRTFDYEPPAAIDGLTIAQLPRDLLDARLRRLKSHWRLYGQMVTRPLPELESAFRNCLDAVVSGRRVEAILSFANVPSIERVARHCGLPIIHTHFGPLRGPAYVMTGYWDTRGVNSRTDVVRRFRAFRREFARTPVSLLDRTEILGTMRRVTMPAPVEPADARFRVGVALQGEENAHVHGLGNLDLVTFARRSFDRSQILVRHHAGAVTRVSEAFGEPDASQSSTEFIQACETILTVNSGIALESLLLGRRCVMLGDSPFRIVADSSLEAPTRHSEHRTLLALNFLAFGYIVPYALMFDPDYTRWRLTRPPELDIFRYHQQWFRTHLIPLGTTSQPAVLLLADKLGTGIREFGIGGPLFMFGAGETARAVLEQLKDRFNVQGIFDNDPRKWNSTICGVRVGPPAHHAAANVFINSVTHAEPMMEQLKTLGYPSSRVIRMPQEIAS